MTEFEEYLKGIFEINNGIENDADNLVHIHAPELLKLAKKELAKDVIEDTQPASDDPEKAAKEYAYYERGDDVPGEGGYDLSKLEGFLKGEQWRKEQDEKNIGDRLWNAYLKGEKETKEQMLKDAVEAVVSQVPCSNEIIFHNPASVSYWYLPSEMNRLGLNKGDKVKIIIIKE